MKNRIQDLRDHLFATIEDLRDKESPMDLARAKAIADVAQAIINSAKVEVEAMQVLGLSQGTGFLPQEEKPGPRLIEGRRR